jgi:hypothetical protein
MTEAQGGDAFWSYLRKFCATSTTIGGRVLTAMIAEGLPALVHGGRSELQGPLDWLIDCFGAGAPELGGQADIDGIVAQLRSSHKKCVLQEKLTAMSAASSDVALTDKEKKDILKMNKVQLAEKIISMPSFSIADFELEPNGGEDRWIQLCRSVVDLLITK